MSEYYCLTSSLKELSADSEAKDLNLALLFEEIEESLSEEDVTYYRDFKAQYDIQNLINFISGRVSSFNKMGNLSKTEIEKVTDNFRNLKKEGAFEESDFYNLKPYIVSTLVAYKDSISATESEIDTSQPIDKTLQGIYYDCMCDSANCFIKNWFSFERDIRNICAASIARSKGIDIEDVVIDEGDIQSQLKSSPAADFGLRGMFDYTDELFAILSSDDMLQKERKLDDIRWEHINELNIADYFTLNGILGYLAKAAIVNRWFVLDEKTGRAMFERLTKELVANKLIIDNN